MPNSMLKKFFIFQALYHSLNIQIEISWLNAQTGTKFTLFEPKLDEVIIASNCRRCREHKGTIGYFESALQPNPYADPACQVESIFLVCHF